MKEGIQMIYITAIQQMRAFIFSGGITQRNNPLSTAFHPVNKANIVNNPLMRLWNFTAIPKHYG